MQEWSLRGNGSQPSCDLILFKIMVRLLLPESTLFNTGYCFLDFLISAINWTRLLLTSIRSFDVWYCPYSFSTKPPKMKDVNLNNVKPPSTCYCEEVWVTIEWFDLFKRLISGYVKASDYLGCRITVLRHSHLLSLVLKDHISDSYLPFEFTPPETCTTPSEIEIAKFFLPSMSVLSFTAWYFIWPWLDSRSITALWMSAEHIFIPLFIFSNGCWPEKLMTCN